jgi:hypothetical protein
MYCEQGRYWDKMVVTSQDNTQHLPEAEENRGESQHISTLTKTHFEYN